MAEPRVSVALPVHNGRAFIAEAIRSVLGQSFRDFELVVGDDGSDDGTGEIVERIASTDSVGSPGTELEFAL